MNKLAFLSFLNSNFENVFTINEFKGIILVLANLGEGNSSICESLDHEIIASLPETID